VERRQRPATVTADVKALFNGGNAQSQSHNSFRSVDDSLGFAGPLSYHDPRRVNDYWQPTSVSGRSDSEMSKRDSDPVIQDKLRSGGGNGPPQSHATRSVSGRTQSLDISSLSFSRALTGQSSAFGPVPPSPGVASSSPGTATSQYFPGHAPSTLRANVTGRPVSSYDSYDGVDGVTHGEWFHSPPCFSPPYHTTRRLSILLLISPHPCMAADMQACQTFRYRISNAPPLSSLDTLH